MSIGPETASLAGRVAVVTGGGTGIGQGIAGGFAAFGAKVAIWEQDADSAAVFLASDLSSYVTGQTIHVDGGTQAAGGWYPHPDGTGAYALGPS